MDPNYVNNRMEEIGDISRRAYSLDWKIAKNLNMTDVHVTINPNPNLNVFQKDGEAIE